MLIDFNYTSKNRHLQSFLADCQFNYDNPPQTTSRKEYYSNETSPVYQRQVVEGGDR